MFLNTGNHLGLQEDTHYCPNATCWCVNCQLICMQKVHQFPVCFIYEESLQIQNTDKCQLVPMLSMCQLSAYLSATDAPLDCSQLASYMKRVCMQKDMSTCPNAFDVSTVSISVSKRCTFGLFPASYMKRVCLQKESMFAERHVNLSQSCCCVNCQHICKHVPRILKDHTMANHNKAFHAIPDHGKP